MLLHQALAAAKPTVLNEALAETLRASLGPVSDRMWRDLIRESEVPLAPLVEGVRQEDFPALERTLLALATEYEQAGFEKDVLRQKRVRRLVIAAKDHARLVTRNASTEEAKRAQKEEMILWMLTWLDNPSVFETWVTLRKPRITAVPATPPE